ncbi:MAG: polysaccharide lyase 6 family protein [Paludibacter sp.]
MIAKSKILILLAFLQCINVFATTYKVGNIDEYKQKSKTLFAGDTIVLANGVWNDAQLVLKGKGEQGKQINLIGETPGKVFLQGKSCLNLSGNYLSVSGLVFKNGFSPKGTVIDFRTSSKDYAYNSVVSNCVIDKFNQPVKDSMDHWIGVWGKKNVVEYCYFGGKSNEGTTLVVWPNDSNSTNNGHLIYRNYFGARPRLGANGGESIRIGTSQVCHLSSGTIVDGNYFEHCNGEVEVISNKSCDNILVNNTFFECEGSLVLRHGNNATVAGNWFIGNGKPFTGGVRVINEGHKIYNNFFYKLAGEDFRSGLTIMNAIPDSPPNGYAPVKNVLFANNTFYDCAFPWAFGVGFGERNRTVKPESTLLLNNLVYCPNTKELVKFYDQTDGVRFDNNIMVNSTGNSTDKGAVAGEALKTTVNGYEAVYSTAKAKKLPFVKYDILGQIRSEAVIGAFQNKGENPTLDYASSKNCGPSWYKASAENAEKKLTPAGKTITVAAGTDVLTQVLKKAGNGDVLLLSAGEHIITNKLAINKSIILKSADTKTKPVIKLQSSRENNAFFEIGANARLSIDGIAINGDSKAAFPAKYVFATGKEGAVNYALHLNNCDIYDVKVASGAIFKAYKTSYADSIVIKNSVLRDSYRGISLADEKDDIGKYNAETVIIDNTVFSNIDQFAIDYYRGGNDESTLGGALKIDHCVFDNVGIDEKQTILKLNRIVTVAISNSIFANSMAKTSVRLTGNKNSVSNCCFSACADPKTESGATISKLNNESVKFEKKSFNLAKKSKLIGIASDGGNIGLK